MKEQQVLRCDLHDYIEVACLFNYQILITLSNGDIAEGYAQTTSWSLDRQEVLLIEEADAVEQREIPLLEIATIKVLTKGAQFELIRFV